MTCSSLTIQLRSLFFTVLNVFSGFSPVPEPARSPLPAQTIITIVFRVFVFFFVEMHSSYLGDLILYKLPAEESDQHFSFLSLSF